ncbi:MAG: multidrug transporter [Pseudomonadota bacterium]|nr:multidrug transporter [Pseudomonadota bacterium]
MLKFSSRLWPYIIAAACAAAPFPTARVARADHVAELGGGAYQYNYGRRFHSGYANPSTKADYMAADGLLARPLGIAATAIGAGIYIATLPFSLLGGNADEAARILVRDPAWYTFQRCLGCLYPESSGALSRTPGGAEETR